MTEYKIALVGFGGVNRGLAQLIATNNDNWQATLGFSLKIVGVTDLFLGSVVDRNGLDAAALAALPSEKGALAQIAGGTAEAFNETVIKQSGADIIAEATFTNPVDGEPAATFCRWALEAGKHVLCEKPLAMNTAESAALVAIAAKYPKQAAGVNYNIRYYPLCIEAKDRVRKKELGDIFHITGSYSQDWLLYDTDYNWRVLDSEGGELRAVSDIGTHWLDLIYFITGLEVESVCGDLQTVHPVRKRSRGEIATFQGKGQAFVDTENIPITTDDYGSILLRFKGGK